MNHAPRRLVAISILFMICGSLSILPAIGFCLIGSETLANLDKTGGGGPGLGVALMGMFLSFAGSLGVALGLLTTLAGLGLKRMKRWGLWSSYVVLGLWILLGILVLFVFGSSLLFELSFIGLVGGLVGVGIIGFPVKVGIYLRQKRDCFKS
jgi:hypothetical protein